MSWILAHKTLFILALTDGYAIIVRQNGTVFWHDVIKIMDANWISVPAGLNFALIVFKLHDQVPNASERTIVKFQHLDRHGRLNRSRFVSKNGLVDHTVSYEHV